jgi:hypothetical protein
VDSALAMRAYTASKIDSLLSAQMQHQFLPQSVPFYATTQNFLIESERDRCAFINACRQFLPLRS